VIGLVSASLVIITVDYRQEGGILDDMGGAAVAALAPLQRGVTAIAQPIGNFFTGLANLPSLAEENERLRDELADAQAQLVRAESRDIAYRSLYQILELTQTLDPDGVPAVVVANGVSNFDWTVTIDHGSDDGIEVGMPVVTGSSQGARLVGSVASVTGGESVVQLIIDPDHHVAGVIGDSREIGLVSGQGYADMTMDYVERVDRTVGGDEAVPVATTSYEIGGQVGRYPPNLLIGTVSSSLQEINAGQVTLQVRPAVDFSSLEFVLVLKSPSGGAT
jgi:rod shape-determining protein MreC